MVKLYSTGSEAGRAIRTLISIFKIIYFRGEYGSFIICINSASGGQYFETLRELLAGSSPSASAMQS